ncbi:efflux RND transporter periplasmic adaptor subunit [Aquisalinus flavus]|nr:efflux RND transporter periplasmic adaptor subunit [Aquisalinus flavus]
MNGDHQQGAERKKSRFRLMTVFPVVLAVGFAVAILFLYATQPRTRMQQPEAKRPVVEALALRTETRDVTTSAQGVVAAANGTVELRPQVSGDVIATHPNYKPGGYIPAGETLLQIDRTDYELALADARAALNQARATVDIEKGQQRIAEAEFELLEGDIEFDTASRALALRQPQLQRVEADYEAALSAVDRAQLNLRRTSLSLPYDVVVLGVDAIEGEYLGAREVAGTLARADEFWVELRVRHDVLARLDTRSADGTGSAVRLSLNGTEYPGEVIRIRADVSEETRLGGVYVGVDDPLSMRPENEDRPPLLIGSYVAATLQVGSVDDVIVMPRRALQDNNMVYVATAEDRLDIRPVQIAWELDDEVLVRPTFEAGDRIITSRVSGIAPGTELRVRLNGTETGGNGEVSAVDSAGDSGAGSTATSGSN